MPKPFKTISLKKWDGIHKHQKDGWIFRGQSGVDWDLVPSIERICRDLKWPLSDMPETERTLTRDFKRHWHLYGTHFPRKIRETEDDLEWLSIMQHHGAPTRLLDFTYSIYVAAYFAVEGALIPNRGPTNSVVWAIDSSWAHDEGARKFSLSSKERRYLVARLDDKNPRDWLALTKVCSLSEPREALVIIVNPYRLNDRLSIQKGVFACPTKLTISFEDNLRAIRGWEDKVIKYIIPKRERNAAILNLHNMGISRISLFPGLDGFAHALKFTRPLLWKRIRAVESTLLKK